MKKLIAILLLFSLITCPAEGAWRKTKAWESKPPVGSQIDWSNPLTRGLVGCWLMNEGGGNTIKNLSSNIVSTGTNNPPSTLFRKGIGRLFNGTNQYFDLGNSSFVNITNGITIVASCKFNLLITGVGAGEFNTIIAKRATVDTNGINYAFRAGQNSLDANATGKITFFYYNSGYNIFETTGVTLSVNEVAQVAISYKSGVGSSAKIYKNAIPITSSWILGDGNSALLTNSTNATLGWSNAAEYFDGVIDYVFLYNRALSPSEIQSLYANPYQFIIAPKRRIISPTTNITTKTHHRAYIID